MPFDDFRFLFIFLPCLLLGWMVVTRSPLRHRKLVAGVFVGLVSAYFYWLGAPDFFLLLVLLTLFNFFLAQRLLANPRSSIYWVGMAVDIGVLAYFKYANFGVGTLHALTGIALPHLAIILPIGISFFTFQKIAYLTDIRRGEQEKWKIGEFFLLVWFFPQLIAGPIVRPHEFIPQWRALQWDKRTLATNLAVGLTLFFVGLIKKIGIADVVAPYADLVFDPATHGAAPRLTDAWIGALAFTARIYFDFSAYSDMAIGLARMLGIKLPINFFSPYKASSIIDFWRRWHMTLSRFLRDYLYFPLGGNRLGRVRRYINLMIVMLIGGLWHGANWTFVVWGGLQGIYLAINHLWRDCGLRMPVLVGWVLTMVAVVFAWVPFRAPDWETTKAVWAGMVGLNGIVLPASDFANSLAHQWPGYVEIRSPWNAYVAVQGRLATLVLPLSLFAAVVLPNVYQWLGRYEPALYFEKEKQVTGWWPSWSPKFWIAGAVAALTLFVLFNAGRPQVYLYWQF